MIIGTAGHIDHGKTTLVHALTGVDTDRLPEEKRRGITIELGFAPLALDGVGIAGVVDVPGHEAFVRTMVAGATGIDLALVVIAADEGVMPQTREHLAILGLLGTRQAVVALTKRDLVDEEWLELVRADVARELAGTPLASAPIVETSTATGAGIDALRQALAEAARSIPRRDADDLFRMPVDRVFSVRGTGTVVTGTVWSGSVRADATVVLQPSGRPARVRGVQVHGTDVPVAEPATRVAVALAGVDVGDVSRGSWLVSDARWTPTIVMRGEVALLDDAGPLKPREWVRFHLGTADVSARVVASGGAVVPGERRAVRIRLQEPVVARSGDRFVLRRGSPAGTIGGGIVTDPLPAHRRARPWPLEANDPADRLRLMLAEAGWHGVEYDHLTLRLGLRDGEVAEVVRRTSEVVHVGRRIFALDHTKSLSRELESAIDRFHGSAPLEEGIAVAVLRAQTAAGAELVEHALQQLVRDGVVELRGPLVSRFKWTPRVDARQELIRQNVLSELRAADAEPPTVAALSERHHSDVVPLLRMLEKDGLVIAVEADRYYAQESVGRLVEKLRAAMIPGREYSPTEIRDVLGISRKYLIPFLEFCDRKRITERRTTGRVLHER
jgi:selenocysteine-specific elongation factor